VREQEGLGRILPLGGPRDGAWIAARAAASVLRSAARAVEGVPLDALRIGRAAPEAAGEPAVPGPASALPPGALRLRAAVGGTGGGGCAAGRAADRARRAGGGGRAGGARAGERPAAGGAPRDGGVRGHGRRAAAGDGGPAAGGAGRGARRAARPGGRRGG